MRASWSVTLLLLLPAAVVHATPPRTVGFRESALRYYGHAPVGLVLGDLDRDGRPDVACANDDSTVSILLGNGAGELPVQHDQLVGSALLGIALGDFNHDELDDLAVSSAEAGTVLLLFSAGDGTIAGTSSLHGPWSPGALALLPRGALGPDLVAADLFFQELVVARDDGTGYQFASQVPGFLDPVSMAVGDVARDAFPDVAVADAASHVGTVVNDIGGPAETRRDQPLAGRPVAVALGDVDRDGHDDLVVATRSPSALAVCRGAADGSIAPARADAAGPAPVALVLADFDADGRLDAALADSASRSIGIWVGRGDGTFLKLGDIPTGDGPVALASADMNLDGWPDLVCANHDEGSVRVFLNTSTLAAGTFHLFSPTPNPASGPSLITFALSGSMTVHVEVYDLAGRLVRTLVTGVVMPAGPHSVTWDGRTDAGDPARSGTYYVRLRAGGGEATTRLALQR